MSIIHKKKISLIVAVYFEEDCITQFIKETEAVLKTLSIDYEIIFIDDGSTDNTVLLIKESAKTSPNIKLIELSYNQGKPIAVSSGISYATGHYLLCMDPDLQDPPNEIPNFIAEIEKGYDLVFGLRKEKRDSFINRLQSKIFWRFLNKLSGLQIPENIAVMRIFNRKFANKFLEYSEQSRFIEGIFMHIGMKRGSLLIEQQERFAGKSKFNFSRKKSLALDAIFDFSEIPLKIAVKIGAYLFVGSLIFLICIFISKLLFVDFQAGWASIICFITLFSGLQLIFTGIAAMYIGRIYKEVKKRPLYSIKELTNL